jgi:AcrR family transcriptional regulator
MAATTNERILEKSMELFTRFGINSVRTDDITMNLGISKKTFYQHYASKEQLVTCVTERLLCDALTEINKRISTCSNSIKQASEIWDTLIVFRKKYNPNFLLNVERHYIGAWNLIEAFRKEYLTQVLIQNLRKGVSQSYYRADVNEEVMAALWLDMSRLQYDISNSEMEIKHHFIRSLLTTTGFENYSQVLCNEESKKELA